MERDFLGKTKLKASKIGLGCEWLHKQPTKIVKAVIDKAITHGINYFDVVYNFEEYLQNLHIAFKDHKREDLILTHHLGSGIKKGEKGEKYQKTRSLQKIQYLLDNYLKIIDTDYADIGLVHFVMNEKQYEECCKENGVFELAHQLQKDGKIRYVGMSTHDPNVAIHAANNNIVDIIMIQVNMANNAMPNRNQALSICAKNDVGVVAMKPYAGGKLLLEGSVNIAGYQRGGKGIKKSIKTSISTVRCLHYVLSQPGLSVALPGVKNIEELDQVLSYLTATPEERDYSDVLKEFKEYKEHECVFCDHCSPCSQGIDIGKVFRLYHIALHSKSISTRTAYEKIEHKASECTQCYVCIPRCPFDVPIVENMEVVAKLFGS